MELSDQIKFLNEALEKTKQYFLENVKKANSPIQIYTHIDTDGLSAGAIIGKALYRANIPFQIQILRQLEREEIIKIAKQIKDYNNFLIFCDFGSGQYLELQEKLTFDGKLASFLILDHHLPQEISSKDESEAIQDLYEKTSPWQVNPYFYGINGSFEVSGAGMCYQFAKCLDIQNKDLSQIAIIGAIGDIQNQGPNRTFTGLNSIILKDAIEQDLIEVVDDLNFSSIKPLNEAIAYSNDIKLPGLTNHINKTLKFLKTLGILMENSDGELRTLSDMNTDEKQKISTAIIEYSTLKLNLEPSEIIEKLIVKRFLLKNEPKESELFDLNEFSNLLNACRRTSNGSLGIAIAMGDRKKAYQEAQENRKIYKKSIVESLSWLTENEKIQQKQHIQYYFGEDIIPESIIGVIASMLVFNESGIIDRKKPIFGIAKREDEAVYKISGRAHESIVEKGVNLSEAIREALKLSDLDALGGGHPPAAGTKVPIDKIDDFLNNIDIVINKQIKK